MRFQRNKKMIEHKMQVLGAVLLAAASASCSVTPAVSTPPLVTHRTSLQPVSLVTPTPTPYRVPSWAHGRVINKVPVKPGDRCIAITFDDGPWPRTTAQVLSILRQYHIHATFFVLGPQVREQADLVRREMREGHAVGNHSWSHPYATRRPEFELDATSKAIRQATGQAPVLFRPPYGIVNNRLTQLALRRGMPVFLWSVDCADWKRPPSSYIRRRVVNYSTPGGIILLHDGGGNRSNTVEALPGIIEDLQAKGYQFLTIPELLKHYSPAAAKLAATKSKRTGKSRPKRRHHRHH